MLVRQGSANVPPSDLSLLRISLDLCCLIRTSKFLIRTLKETSCRQVDEGLKTGAHWASGQVDCSAVEWFHVNLHINCSILSPQCITLWKINFPDLRTFIGHIFQLRILIMRFNWLSNLIGLFCFATEEGVSGIKVSVFFIVWAFIIKKLFSTLFESFSEVRVLC